MSCRLIAAANDDVFEFLEALYLRIIEAGKADGGGLATFFVADGTAGPVAAARAAAQPDVSICRMSPESGEICKLASNCFRTTKISFANLIGDIADRTPGADKHDICRALGRDTSIGPKCLRPGFGFGGPCYPRDNRALAQYAASVGIRATIPEATDAYNELHHDLMAATILARGPGLVDEAAVTEAAAAAAAAAAAIAGAAARKPEDSADLEGAVEAPYVFEDVGYKPKLNVPMIDESPKLAVAQRLVKAGKRVVIRDCRSKVRECMKRFGGLFEYVVTSDD